MAYTVNPITGKLDYYQPGGDPGPAGAAGASAYEVAVSNGFVGDENAWVLSLVGQQGIQG